MRHALRFRMGFPEKIRETLADPEHDARSGLMVDLRSAFVRDGEAPSMAGKGNGADRRDGDKVGRERVGPNLFRGQGSLGLNMGAWI